MRRNDRMRFSSMIFLVMLIASIEIIIEEAFYRIEFWVDHIDDLKPPAPPYKRISYRKIKLTKERYEILRTKYLVKGQESFKHMMRDTFGEYPTWTLGEDLVAKEFIDFVMDQIYKPLALQ